MTVFHNKKGDNEVSEEVYKEFLEKVPAGLFRYHSDSVGELDFVNTGVFDIFGCKDFEEFTQLTGNTFQGMVYPEDWDRVSKSIEEQALANAAGSTQYRIQRADGEIRWVNDTGKLVLDSSGERWIYVTIVDITDQIEARHKLEKANEQLEILTALSNDVLFDIECSTGETHVYGDFYSRFGRDPQQSDFVIRRRCQNECHININSHDLSHLIEMIEGNNLVDFCTSTPGPDGEPIWYRYQSLVLFDENGVPKRHIGRLLDTHDMVVRETQFRRKAERDDLTGLYNRAAALDRIETLLNTETRPYTLIALDVDNFKEVNDTYGHPEGDRVLKTLGTFLTKAMRSEDIIARMGGDEFAIFAPGLVPGPAMERVLTHLSKGPFVDSEKPDYEKGVEAADSDDAPQMATPTISVGAVCCMKPPIEFDELYSVADKALYESKNSGKARYELIVLD